MIRKLWIESFKAFAEAPSGADPAIPLQPFTVLVGPNGSGKSTILQAVDMLAWLSNATINEMLKEHGWEYADIPHLRSDRKKILVGAEVELPQPAGRVRWSLELGTRRYPGIVREKIERVRADGTDALLVRDGRVVRHRSERTGQEEVTRLTLPASWLSTLDAREDARDHPTLVALAQLAKRIRAYYFLDPVALRAPSRGREALGDDLGFHGENLAAFLGRIRARPKDFARLVDRVRTYYPRLVDIHVRRKSYGWTHFEVTEKWNGEQATFNARQVSDGLLRLIAVSAMHEMAEPPSVLLLDEIENGLHPRLLGGFVEMLEQLANAGRTQVIVATHSPITVNYVSSPESVLLVTRGGKGGVRVTPLQETRGFRSLREQFALGELWYNAGEERLVPKGEAH